MLEVGGILVDHDRTGTVGNPITDQLLISLECMGIRTLEHFPYIYVPN